ncbi:hypothetical protein MS3_00007279 [Schistosoma haematobium]|uniref:Small acidic protein-like domain-containing protein n=1 Tax=Schistosoma haematobium TaxID=6185 RepID=A0A922LGD3_SCHHA|nr:hypothetical protein MS3_00007279 [Schistosoma haematobium]KAH9582572.1 hypothetical protein MS3_00007279 [Schistosoma haematobium]
MENDGQGDFKLTDVRSPNDWEHADLGSKDRNIKFLKLMGGNPVRDHKGKLVIGENIDNVHELENQYLQGLEKSMQPNCHHGLGSHTNSSSNPVDSLDYTNTEKLKQQYKSSFISGKDS